MFEKFVIYVVFLTLVELIFQFMMWVHINRRIDRLELKKDEADLLIKTPYDD